MAHYIATNAINTLNSTTTTTCGTTPDWPYWHSSIARFENCYMCVAGSLNTVNVTCSNSSYHDSSIIMWPQWHNSIMMTEDEYIIAIETERARILFEQERHQEYERRESIRIEEQKVAVEKAQQILLDHLTPNQKEAVEKNGWFVIEGGMSKKKYKIKTRTVAGNVEEIDDKGIVIAKYCCHISHNFPSPDHHLAQKLMLEWDESEFLKIANKTNVA